MAAASGRIAGKRAVLTGASQGIGRATAERLAAEGARVGLIAGIEVPELDAPVHRLDLEVWQHVISTNPTGNSWPANTASGICLQRGAEPWSAPAHPADDASYVTGSCHVVDGGQTIV